MDRVIKFRCWHLNGKRIAGKPLSVKNFEPAMIYDEDPGDCLRWKREGQDIEAIMQFTGLVDANDKEIYEGDIIQFTSLSYGKIAAPVEYLLGNARFGAVTYTGRARQVEMPDRKWDQPHNPCKCDGAMYQGMSILDTGDTFAAKNARVEVIGNIYANPELLEAPDA